MEEVKLWREKIEDIGRRIRALLIKDASVYFQRAVREGVAASPVRIAACNKKQLKALKAKTVKAEAAAVKALEEVLTDEVFFERPTSTVSIKGIATIAAALRELEAAARACVAAVDLEETDALSYRPPVRFIDGEDLVTLTRALFKAQARLRDSTAQEEARSAKESKLDALARWDEL